MSYSSMIIIHYRYFLCYLYAIINSFMCNDEDYDSLVNNDFRLYQEIAGHKEAVSRVGRFSFF